MILTRLVYFSENNMDFSHGAALAGLKPILAASNRNNEAAGITGALVFDDQWFLQALEGDRAKVWETLRRIEDDDRHANVVIVESRRVGERLFGNWRMRLATRTAETHASFASFSKNGLLQPQNMETDDILSLMTRLCRPNQTQRPEAVA